MRAALHSVAKYFHHCWRLAYLNPYLEIRTALGRDIFCNTNQGTGTSPDGYIVTIVQLVRASDCGSECRGFESH